MARELSAASAKASAHTAAAHTAGALERLNGASDGADESLNQCAHLPNLHRRIVDWRRLGRQRLELGNTLVELRGTLEESRSVRGEGRAL